jgi:hypothetical protein
MSESTPIVSVKGEDKENVEVKSNGISWSILGFSSFLGLYIILSCISVSAYLNNNIDPDKPGTNACVKDLGQSNSKNVIISNLVFAIISFIISGFLIKKGSTFFGILMIVSSIMAIIGLGIALGFIRKIDTNITNDVCISSSDFKKLQAGLIVSIVSGALILFSIIALSIKNCPNNLLLNIKK